MWEKESRTSEIRTFKDAEDFVRGYTLLGTGGGGHPKKGLKLLLEDLEQDLEIKFEDPSRRFSGGVNENRGCF